MLLGGSISSDFKSEVFLKTTFLFHLQLLDLYVESSKHFDDVHCKHILQANIDVNKLRIVINLLNNHKLSQLITIIINYQNN